MQLHPELHRRYFERATDLVWKTAQYQPSEEDFKPGFKEKDKIFQIFLKRFC